MRTGNPPTKVTFLGTRGGIKLRSRRHWYHSALLIERAGARVMIDCGADWLGRLCRIRPGAILLTHAHPDQAAGLARGAPCTVYAPPRTFELLRRYPIEDKREMPLRSILIMRQLSSNFAGVKKRAFATPFLPIADLRSWAGTRGSSMRKSRSLASSRALQHGSQRIKISSFFPTGGAPFSPHEGRRLWAGRVFSSDQYAGCDSSSRYSGGGVAPLARSAFGRSSCSGCPCSM